MVTQAQRGGMSLEELSPAHTHNDALIVNSKVVSQ